MQKAPDILRTIVCRNDFPAWLTSHGYKGTAVEVGVHEGGFSSHILSNWPGTLFCVDSWRKWPTEEYQDDMNNWDHEAHYQTTVRDLAKFGIRSQIRRMSSSEAAPWFDTGSLDFVYIDANHASEYVAQDIFLWWPKVRSGGVLCGHDFYYKCPSHSAMDAVCDFSEAIGVRPHVTWCGSWFFLNP